MKKKIILMCVTFCTMFISGYAQSSNPSNSFIKGGDINLMYQPEAKMYGIELGGDWLPFLGSLLQFSHNLKFGKNEYTSYGFLLGIGFSPRYMINNQFLIQGKLYPYMAIDQVRGPETTIGNKNSKYHYTYTPSDGKVYFGALLDLQVGIKVAGKPDRPYFITAGYKVYAPKFKTDGMFKYGYWMIGLTVGNI